MLNYTYGTTIFLRGKLHLTRHIMNWFVFVVFPDRGGLHCKNGYCQCVQPQREQTESRPWLFSIWPGASITRLQSDNLRPLPSACSISQRTEGKMHLSTHQMDWDLQWYATTWCCWPNPASPPSFERMQPYDLLSLQVVVHVTLK